MAYLRSSQASRKPPHALSTARREELLTLRDWLSFSWFLPEEFCAQEIHERSEEFLVHGRCESYRFFKTDPFLPPDAALMISRLRRIKREIVDNSVFAPNYYRGVRFLRWEGGEPEWISEEPSLEFNPHLPPEGANDFAVVTKRLFDNCSLESLADSGDENLDEIISQTAIKLSRYHRGLDRHELETVVTDGNFYARRLENKVEDVLARIKAAQNLLPEVISPEIILRLEKYLKTFLRNNLELFKARARERFIRSGSRDFLAQNIYAEPCGEGKYLISILNRATQSRHRRVDDLLSEVASLVVDLERLGHYSLAREFEAAYSLSNKKAIHSQLYNFYLVFEAVDRFLTIVEKKCGVKSLKDAQAIIGFALSASFDLAKGFLILVQSRETFKAIDRTAFGAKLSSICSAKFIDGFDLHSLNTPDLKNLNVPFENLAGVLEREIRNSSRIVISTPLLLPHQRVVLEQLAWRGNISCVFVSDGLNPRIGKSSNQFQINSDPSNFGGKFLELLNFLSGLRTGEISP